MYLDMLNKFGKFPVRKLKCMLAAGVLGVMPFHPVNLHAADPTGKPNVIFVLVDDMGYGDLGILFQQQRAKNNDRSEPWELTPNLDKLGESGATMPQHYCAAPVCAPSRASLLLGRSQGHSNVRDNQFDKALDENYTLASVMREAGYATAAFGKWGLQGIDDAEPNWSAHPLNRGFDYFLGYIRHKDGHEHYPKEGLYDGPKEVWENRTEISATLDKCYTADLWTAAAKKWIKAHREGDTSDKPFFIYLAYDTPHAVLELPSTSYPAGGGLHGGIQWTGRDGQMINTAKGNVDSWIHPDYANATWDDDEDPSTPEVPWPDVYKRYATDTRRIDDGVGDIIRLLKDLDLYENTMIVFTSDNGPSIESYLPDEPVQPTFFNSFGPFDGIKRDCWEGGIRMPTLAAFPGRIPAGRNVETPSISYDWMATFADLAGVPAPAVCDGVSLMPSLSGKGKQTPSNIYIEYFQRGHTPEFDEFDPAHRGRLRRQMQVVRLDNYVGVRYNIQSAGDEFEIYEVMNDPQQVRNLAGQPGMQPVQQQFQAMALQSRRPNRSAPRPYDDALIPAVEDAGELPGLTWSVYYGNFPWVPDTRTLIADASGTAEMPDAAADHLDQEGALQLKGYIRVPANGMYTFYMNAENKAVLRLHQATLIDEDYSYLHGTRKKAAIYLEAGLHPVSITLLKSNQRGPRLNLEWEGPGIEEQEIPGTLFSHPAG